MRRILVTAVSFAAAVAITTTAGGCGFVNASGKSDFKPSGFVLVGHAETPLFPAGAPSGSPVVGAPTSGSGAASSPRSGSPASGSPTSGSPASAAPTPGSPCQAPVGVTDVALNTEVTVTDQGGHWLAAGRLGAGVVATSSAGLSCQFPFSISAVPGGQTTYNVAIGNRPAETFQGVDLQTNTPAVIAITP